MRNYDATCIICGAIQNVHAYSEYVCTGCGQKYEYEEGHMIELSDEQIQSLRQIPRIEKTEHSDGT